MGQQNWGKLDLLFQIKHFKPRFWSDNIRKKVHNSNKLPQHILPHFVVCPANFSLNLHFTQSFQASYEVNILWRWFYFYRYSGLSEYCDKSGKVLKALSCIYFSLSPFCKWKILFDATNKWWNHSYIALYLLLSRTKSCCIYYLWTLQGSARYYISKIIMSISLDVCK